MKWRGFTKDVALAQSSADLLMQYAPGDFNIQPSHTATNSVGSETPPPTISPTSPKSLLISQNLEALLEHDEQTRPSVDTGSFLLLSRTPSSVSEDSVLASPSPSPNPESDGFVGLTPPPRGPRKFRPRQKQRAGEAGMEQSAQLAGTTSLASPLGLAKPQAPVSLPSFVPTRSPLGKTAFEEGITVTGEGVAVPLSKDKSGNLEAAPSNLEVETAHEASPDGRVPLKPLNPGPTSRRATRPLLTHVHTSSQDSSHYPSSQSSHDPPSTAHEARISISSTIYPSSSYVNSQYALESVTVESPDDASELLFPGNDSLSIQSHPQLDSSIVSSNQSRSSLGSADSSPRSVHSNHIPHFVDPHGSPPSDASPIDHLHSLPSHPYHHKLSPSDSRLAKPDLTKPFIRRSVSAQPSTTKRLQALSPPTSPQLTSLLPQNLLFRTDRDCATHAVLPPTTNTLNPQERADLVRKTRKLTQLFGQTPASTTMSPSSPDSPRAINCLLPMVPSRRTHTRGAISMSDDLKIFVPRSASASAAADPTRNPSPLSPITFSDAHHGLEDDDEHISPPAGVESIYRFKQRTSFLTTSDGAVDEDKNAAPPDTPRMSALDRFQASRLLRSPSTPSFAESMSEEQQAEDERRRKREKLAKLHRFLGSRVPPDLVLGPSTTGVPLPPVSQPGVAGSPNTDSSDAPKNMRLPRRRRSSSSAAFPSHWSDDTDRIKEDLKDKEKAINVRRALKMEKLFGEQPPQNLYHTRLHITSGYAPLVNRPDDRNISIALGAPISAPSSPTGRNLNRSAYLKIKTKKSSSRPGTAESSKGLLSNRESQFIDADPIQERVANGQGVAQAMSAVYMHYRHSLNSLTDIVNRDDKQSLAELHELLHDADGINEDVVLRPTNSAPSTRAERRRSLPLQPSSASLRSEFTITTPNPEVTAFQLRRRRAAKLTHFFGVDYRDLFGDVLDSIEMGVKDDAGKGTLRPNEVQDLLMKLQRLKKRRDEFA